MEHSKGKAPGNKAGGMRAHLPASPGNNPMASRKCDLSFGGNAAKHLKTQSGKGQRQFDGNKSRPPAYPEGAYGKMDSDGDYDGSK